MCILYKVGKNTKIKIQNIKLYIFLKDLTNASLISNITRLKHVRGEPFKIYEQINCEKIWFGDHDKAGQGGYFICPKNLTKNSVIYSAGIGLDIGFEKEVINKFGCTIFGFDPTPRSITFMSNQIVNNFVFFPFGIDKEDGFTEFHLPKDPKEFVSGSIHQFPHLEENTLKVPMKKISTIMRELRHTHIDILKMDIEGSEYKVIDEIINMGIEVDQITLEFHHWLFSDGDSLTKESINMLNKAGYYIFGVSASGLEVSFIRCKRKSLLSKLQPFYKIESEQH